MRLEAVSTTLLTAAALSVAAVPVWLTFDPVWARDGRFSLALTILAAIGLVWGVVRRSGSAMAVGFVLLLLVWAAVSEGVVAGEAALMGAAVCVSATFASWAERSPYRWYTNRSLVARRSASLVLAGSAALMVAVVLSNLFDRTPANSSAALVGAFAVGGGVAAVYLMAETGGFSGRSDR